MSAVRVVAAGPATVVEDLGRPGLEHWGVAPSGAFDRAAHGRAQRLVGNPPTAAGLEVVLGGFACAADGDVVVAVTGADCPVEIDGRPESAEVALVVPSGSVVSVGTARAGLRAYVALRGGLAVPAVLGSRSWDAGAAIGPLPVTVGTVLPVGDQVGGRPHYEVVVAPLRPPAELMLVPGPHEDQLPGGGVDVLTAGTWRVGRQSDRMGVRLTLPEGPPSWARRLPAGLPSFPVVPGSVQATPSGELVVLGPDAGVTGGYPVVAVVPAEGLDVLAQCAPGTPVRLRARTRRSPGRGRGSA